METEADISKSVSVPNDECEDKNQKTKEFDKTIAETTKDATPTDDLETLQGEVLTKSPSITKIVSEEPTLKVEEEKSKEEIEITDKPLIQNKEPSNQPFDSEEKSFDMKNETVKEDHDNSNLIDEELDEMNSKKSQENEQNIEEDAKETSDVSPLTLIKEETALTEVNENENNKVIPVSKHTEELSHEAVENPTKFEELSEPDSEIVKSPLKEHQAAYDKVKDDENASDEHKLNYEDCTEETFVIDDEPKQEKINSSVTAETIIEDTIPNESPEESFDKPTDSGEISEPNVPTEKDFSPVRSNEVSERGEVELPKENEINLHATESTVQDTKKEENETLNTHKEEIVPSREDVNEKIDDTPQKDEEILDKEVRDGPSIPILHDSNLDQIKEENLNYLSPETIKETVESFHGDGDGDEAEKLNEEENQNQIIEGDNEIDQLPDSIVKSRDFQDNEIPEINSVPSLDQDDVKDTSEIIPGTSIEETLVRGTQEEKNDLIITNETSIAKDEVYEDRDNLDAKQDAEERVIHEENTAVDISPKIIEEEAPTSSKEEHSEEVHDGPTIPIPQNDTEENIIEDNLTYHSPEKIDEITKSFHGDGDEAEKLKEEDIEDHSKDQLPYSVAENQEFKEDEKDTKQSKEEIPEESETAQINQDDERPEINFVESLEQEVVKQPSVTVPVADIKENLEEKIEEEKKDVNDVNDISEPSLQTETRDLDLNSTEGDTKDDKDSKEINEDVLVANLDIADTEQGSEKHTIPEERDIVDASPKLIEEKTPKSSKEKQSEEVPETIHTVFKSDDVAIKPTIEEENSVIQDSLEVPETIHTVFRSDDDTKKPTIEEEDSIIQDDLEIPEDSETAQARKSLLEEKNQDNESSKVNYVESLSEQSLKTETTDLNLRTTEGDEKPEREGESRDKDSTEISEDVSVGENLNIADTEQGSEKHYIGEERTIVDAIPEVIEEETPKSRKEDQSEEVSETIHTVFKSDDDAEKSTIEEEDAIIQDNLEAPETIHTVFRSEDDTKKPTIEEEDSVIQDTLEVPETIHTVFKSDDDTKKPTIEEEDSIIQDNLEIPEESETFQARSLPEEKNQDDKSSKTNNVESLEPGDLKEPSVTVPVTNINENGVNDISETSLKTETKDLNFNTIEGDAKPEREEKSRDMDFTNIHEDVLVDENLNIADLEHGSEKHHIGEERTIVDVIPEVIEKETPKSPKEDQIEEVPETIHTVFKSDDDAKKPTIEEEDSVIQDNLEVPETIHTVFRSDDGTKNPNIEEEDSIIQDTLEVPETIHTVFRSDDDTKKPTIEEEDSIIQDNLEIPEDSETAQARSLLEEKNQDDKSSKTNYVESSEQEVVKEPIVTVPVTDIKENNVNDISTPSLETKTTKLNLNNTEGDAKLEREGESRDDDSTKINEDVLVPETIHTVFRSDEDTEKPTIEEESVIQDNLEVPETIHTVFRSEDEPTIVEEDTVIPQNFEVPETIHTVFGSSEEKQTIEEDNSVTQDNLEVPETIHTVFKSDDDAKKTTIEEEDSIIQDNLEVPETIHTVFKSDDDDTTKTAIKEEDSIIQDNLENWYYLSTVVQVFETPTIEQETIREETLEEKEKQKVDEQDLPYLPDEEKVINEDSKFELKEQTDTTDSTKEPNLEISREAEISNVNEEFTKQSDEELLKEEVASDKTKQRDISITEISEEKESIDVSEFEKAQASTSLVDETNQDNKSPEIDYVGEDKENEMQEAKNDKNLTNETSEPSGATENTYLKSDSTESDVKTENLTREFKLEPEEEIEGKNSNEKIEEVLIHEEHQKIDEDDTPKPCSLAVGETVIEDSSKEEVFQTPTTEDDTNEQIKDESDHLQNESPNSIEEETSKETYKDEVITTTDSTEELNMDILREKTSLGTETLPKESNEYATPDINDSITASAEVNTELTSSKETEPECGGKRAEKEVNSNNEDINVQSEEISSSPVTTDREIPTVVVEEAGDKVDAITDQTEIYEEHQKIDEDATPKPSSLAVGETVIEDSSKEEVFQTPTTKDDTNEQIKDESDHLQNEILNSFEEKTSKESYKDEVITTTDSTKELKMDTSSEETSLRAETLPKESNECETPATNDSETGSTEANAEFTSSTETEPECDEKRTEKEVMSSSEDTNEKSEEISNSPVITDREIPTVVDEAGDKVDATPDQTEVCEENQKIDGHDTPEISSLAVEEKAIQESSKDDINSIGFKEEIEDLEYESKEKTGTANSTAEPEKLPKESIKKENCMAASEDFNVKSEETSNLEVIRDTEIPRGADEAGEKVEYAIQKTEIEDRTEALGNVSLPACLEDDSASSSIEAGINKENEDVKHSHEELSQRDDEKFSNEEVGSEVISQREISTLDNLKEKDSNESPVQASEMSGENSRVNTIEQEENYSEKLDIASVTEVEEETHLRESKSDDKPEVFEDKDQFDRETDETKIITAMEEINTKENNEPISENIIEKGEDPKPTSEQIIPDSQSNLDEADTTCIKETTITNREEEHKTSLVEKGMHDNISGDSEEDSNTHPEELVRETEPISKTEDKEDLKLEETSESKENVVVEKQESNFIHNIKGAYYAVFGAKDHSNKEIDETEKSLITGDKNNEETLVNETCKPEEDISEMSEFNSPSNEEINELQRPTEHTSLDTLKNKEEVQIKEPKLEGPAIDLVSEETEEVKEEDKSPLTLAPNEASTEKNDEEKAADFSIKEFEMPRENSKINTDSELNLDEANTTCITNREEETKTSIAEKEVHEISNKEISTIDEKFDEKENTPEKIVHEERGEIEHDQVPTKNENVDEVTTPSIKGADETSTVKNEIRDDLGEKSDSLNPPIEPADEIKDTGNDFHAFSELLKLCVRESTEAGKSPSVGEIVTEELDEDKKHEHVTNTIIEKKEDEKINEIEKDDTSTEDLQEGSNNKEILESRELNQFDESESIISQISNEKIMEKEEADKESDQGSKSDETSKEAHKNDELEVEEPSKEKTVTPDSKLDMDETTLTRKEDLNTNLDIPQMAYPVVEEAIHEHVDEKIEEGSKIDPRELSDEIEKETSISIVDSKESAVDYEKQKQTSLEPKYDEIEAKENSTEASLVTDASQEEVTIADKKIKEDENKHDLALDKHVEADMSIEGEKTSISDENAQEEFEESLKDTTNVSDEKPGDAEVDNTIPKYEDGHIPNETERPRETTQINQELEKTSVSTSEKQIPVNADSNEGIKSLLVTTNKDDELVSEMENPKRDSTSTVESEQKTNVSDKENITNIDDTSSLSPLLQKSTKDIHGNAEEKKETAHEEKVKNDEEKHEEDDDIDEHKKDDSGSDAPVMVEASRDMDAKSPHKKSHGILSGVGSKVKHSISKVKKAITGKSSHSKPISPK